MMMFVCLLIGYILGNFSAGMLIARHQGTDIRHEGSGNPGATNVLRVIGARAGILTFIGDFCKAVLAVVLARLLGGEDAQVCSMMGGLGVIIGHNWPAIFGFRGGKGVACSTAVILLVFPAYGAVAVLGCLLVIFLTRYVSMGSMLMLFTHALLLIFFEPFFPYALWGIVLSAMCFYRHRDNIRRLRNSTENRLHLKKTE